MKSRKKKEKTAVAEQETSFESVVDGLAEAVVEELKDEHVNELDPFEHYAQKIRGKIHTDLNIFRSRFVKGYNALMEEIQHEQELPRHSDKSDKAQS